MSLEEV